uniref:Uncharacterized protein n=1 Tax=Hemiselmis andersenii TaxID=464988 RepID=A0A6U4TKZ4_HEMAN|mmetsp:Transcript_25876/g.60064  ORF Transcript_25876/g.60064 Transcript_25876/m.60064 type:complete len:343 (+) Transcript_25876:343-1371(+)
MVQTPLHFACRDGDINLVKDIVDGKGGHAAVELDAVALCGRTPLHIAAKWGRLECARFLVERGANVTLKDDRGRTALDVANEEMTRKYLERVSVKMADQMLDEAARRRAQLRAYTAERDSGDLTEIEFEHQSHRLELDHEWEDTRHARSIRLHEVREEAEQVGMQQLLEFMQTRPAELQEAAYEKSMSDLKKKQAREKKERIEKERLEKIRIAEEQKEKEKKREEKRAKKDLLLERTCYKCLQTFTKETNRDGQCTHFGKWSPWGLDKNGKKCEWEFFWTCCKSTTYEGPCNGLSICARSDPHEESEADIMRRQAKMLKKMSIEQAKRSEASKSSKKPSKSS